MFLPQRSMMPESFRHDPLFPILHTSYRSFASLLVVVMLISVVSGSQSKYNTIEETIDCFECKSNLHNNCRDPFNGTSNIFPLAPCKGCCVKIVRNYNTKQETVWRTCTEKLEISNSLVHRDVCMAESNGQGHLCICSEDKCNSSPPHRAAFSAFSLLYFFFLFRLLCNEIR
ncbi:hypothetical protein RvY_01417 [Ramazzottius varieornatus]|uniref:UPAR/Ly6 domain-containing protein qvr n=1 Tax=Ramazzottius varieornatus TaxID=947166 RepID=A0A1D1UMB9_RAMVA|nr:hypothetical protein RvY_01417 [Ramazzottius varieornatus]